jgi:hypothetical protein
LRPGGGFPPPGQTHPPHDDNDKDAAVKTRALGRTGIQVSPYCLGTMTFGRDAAIGPRTKEQSVDLLDDALPDRIDEIVAPGGDLGPIDVSCAPPDLTQASLRRQPVDERAAA